MNTKKRFLFYEIKKQLNRKEALVITGMRQVGKTTLMKQIFAESPENKLWFDLDNPLDQKIFEDLDYNNIYKKLKAQLPGDKRLFIFIDEIQNFPEITKVIKHLIDHYQVKFIVTGSSSYYLKNLFPESLSGRKFLYKLEPLSFGEYLYFKNIQEKKDFFKKEKLLQSFKRSDIFIHKKHETYYNDYIEFGGFPEVVLTNDKDTKAQILKNIFASFFEKDLKILSDYRDIRELRDLILLLVPRVGSMLDISKIASELSLNRPKIYAYLEFLQGVFFIRLVPKYSKSIDRAVSGGKKIYFSDTGILNMIGRVNESQLFENAVINQLSAYGDISFFNKRNTAEIDVIVDKKIAIELKLRGADQDMKKLVKLSEELKIDKYFIVSKYFKEKKGFISPVVVV